MSRLNRVVDEVAEAVTVVGEFVADQVGLPPEKPLKPSARKAVRKAAVKSALGKKRRVAQK